MVRRRRLRERGAGQRVGTRAQTQAWIGAGCALVVLTVGCERGSTTSPPETQPASSSAAAVTSTAPAPVTLPLAGTAEVVAKVNGTILSITDVELAVAELHRLVELTQQRWEPLPARQTPEALDLTDVLGNVIEVELKAQAARAAGLERQREVQQRLAYLLRGFYAMEWERWQRRAGALAADADIHQFYEQHQAGFVEPERIHLRQLVAETLAQAEAARARAVQGEVFEQLVRELSVGAGKETGGDVGWYVRAEDRERLRVMGREPQGEALFPQLEPVAFALEVHQVSQPVKGPDGRYYLAQLLERQPARQQTELEVRDAIAELLTVQRLQGAVEQLRAQGQVERFPERLEQVKQ